MLKLQVAECFRFRGSGSGLAPSVRTPVQAASAALTAGAQTCRQTSRRDPRHLHALPVNTAGLPLQRLRLLLLYMEQFVPQHS